MPHELRSRPDARPVGVFETSLLSAMWPDRVQLHRLPSPQQPPSHDPDGDVHGNHRHDPGHPLHGVFGPDPRGFDPEKADALVEEIVTWTIDQVDQASRADRTPVVG
jgi:creatinine amidohydrolase